MKKENNILKFFFPLLTVFYFFCMLTISTSVLKSDTFVLSETLLSTFLELICALITIFTAFKLLPKIFANCKNYKTKIPNASVLFSLVLIVPFLVILKYSLVYYVLTANSSKEYQTELFYSQDLFSDIAESISAVFIAPVTEELSFRYMAMSPFKKRSSKILIFIFISLIFSILHIRNFIAVFFDSLILGAVFLITKNIINSIFIHSLINCSSLIFEILSTKNIIEIRYIKLPAVLIFPKNSIIFFFALFMAGIIILLLSKSKTKRGLFSGI